ncbi:MAG: hypothetical protein MR624_01010, partial [Bacteroidales bacterium]|nr:hypothetical protein [Bacteroidales bacterium]
MKKTVYLCDAEQTVRLKAYAGKPDQKTGAPSRGFQSLPNRRPGLLHVRQPEAMCQQNQHV